MTELFQDLKFGWRTLAKSRGFTFVALATLAIGIGANTAIFSFVNGVMLKPLPYAEPERIVRVLEKPPGGDHNGISTLNYLDWAKENKVFEYMAAQTGGSVTLTGVEEPIQLRGMRVSAHYFDVFGVGAALGRTFAEGEDQLGHDNVAVISHALWQNQFGGEKNALGRVVILDGKPCTIVGILPKDSAFNRGWPQIWRPLAFTPEQQTRNFHWMGSMARLKRGVTLEQARAQMNAIGARIAQDYPDSNKGWGVAVDLLVTETVGKELRQSLYVLLAAVGMVLLIACANLANLMLARGAARDREVAIRAALGAGRGRLVRQFLTESILLSVGGGVLGLAVGYGLMATLRTVLPPFSLPSEANVTMDGQVLVFTLVLAVLTGIACGLVPALQATRPDLTTGMKQAGGGATAGKGRHSVRSALVITEVALAFVLLTGAGLLLRSFTRLQNVDPGFDATNVLTAGLPVPEKRFSDTASFNAYFKQLTERLAALPGVRDVALTSALPMRGWGYGMPFQLADKPVVDHANRAACFFKMVSPSYFRALGMKLIRGRALTAQDVKGTPPVAVISEAMRRKYFGNEDPIGKRILIQEIVFGKPQLGPEIPWEVVGIVADEKVGSLDSKEESPGIYVTTEQCPQLYQALIVKTAGDPTLVYRTIRDAVHQVNPDQTVADLKTLEQIKTESMGSNRLRSMLLGVFASVALLLSAIGIYGVVSYSVVQRTREIGIRGALGASASDILRLVLRNGMTMVAIGLAVGAAGVFGLTRLLASLLFGVSERDPITIGAVAAMLATVALLACYFPARRATKVNPLVALRCE